MSQENFSFLDDMLKPPEDVQKLKDEQAIEELQSEEFAEAKKTFSKLDMSTLDYSKVIKNKQYNCIIVQRQVMGQDGMPLLYHRDLQAQTIEIAKENNGHLGRADKVIPDYLKVSQLTDCPVILVHKKKSTDQILAQQKIDRMRQRENNKKVIFASVQYDNGTYKHFKMPAERDALKVELGLFDPESSPVSVYQENRYVVFPSKYIFGGTGGMEVINAIGIIERHVNAEREKENKLPIGASKYYVCNADEPYSEKVLQTILHGEDSKLRNKTKK